MFRLRQFGEARSLWLDEASLALNILPKSFGDLTRHLDFAQVAPVPFLWAVRAATLAFGPGEQPLRLVSLIAGGLVPVFTWLAARRLLGERWGLVALATTASMFGLVYYSNELKPYSVDAVAAITVVWVATRAVRSGSLRDGVILVVTGAAAALFSFGALLVLGGVILALLSTERGRRNTTTLVSCVVLWAGAGGVSLGLAHRLGASSSYLQGFWSESFVDVTASGVGPRLWRLLCDALQQDFVGAPDVWSQGALATVFIGLLATAGVVSLWRRNERDTTVLLTAPLLLTLAASSLRLYPLSARTLLFLTPLVVVLVTAGLRAAAEKLSPNPLLAPVLAAVVLGVVLPVTVERTLHPHRREDLRTVVEGLAREHSGNVYVYARAIPAWTYDTLGRVIASSANDPVSQEERAHFELIRRAAATPGAPCFENTAPAVLGAPEKALEYSSGESERAVLLGLAGGAESQGRTEPSAGWADHEALRMKAAASPGVWLVATHGVGQELPRLQEAITRLGGHVQRTISAEGAWARLYTFS